jgi:hypothetical protein
VNDGSYKECVYTYSKYLTKRFANCNNNIISLIKFFFLIDKFAYKALVESELLANYNHHVV